MSGFEVAGVILGVLPLVIGALSAYRQKKGVLGLRKSHGLLDDLIHRLKTQRTNFYLDILELLREARVPEILVDVDPTEEKCVDILQDAKTSIQAPKDDLVAIILASKSPIAPLALKGRVKFSIDRESLNALTNDLGTERYSLGELIRRVKAKREWESNEPTSSSMTLTLAFAKVRESATLLYQAAYRIARPALITFGLCFPIEQTVLQEIEVAARAIEASRAETVVKFQNGPRDKGSLEVPTITVTATSDESNPTTARVQIKSICDDARKARNQGQVLTLELKSDVLELLEEEGKPQNSYNTLTTLADFLRDTMQDEDARMGPMMQTLLALNVVSSVLQLRPTLWCSIPWNSTLIKFPTKVADGSHIAACTPYVEQTVDADLLQSHTCSPDLNTEAAKTTMLELAILLLEILHHKSIETWAAKNRGGATRTYQDRMRVATRWLELSTSRLLPSHIKAIEECLVFCARSKLAWDDQFQRLYCENIIKPLQQLTL
ncbi:hypothetical protein DL771_006155 [Monosporascus sp. 5C6A]|nr:hypothetical protein DL771_006155 [Monosporascus sp. 5C6A]